jgi:hypothetical protein
MRILAEVGPELGAELLDRAGASKWDLRYSKQRLEAEAAVGIARRHALSPLARDVERNLGRIEKHAQWREAKFRIFTVVNRHNRPITGDQIALAFAGTFHTLNPRFDIGKRHGFTRQIRFHRTAQQFGYGVTVSSGFGFQILFNNLYGVTCNVLAGGQHTNTDK